LIRRRDTAGPHDDSPRRGGKPVESWDALRAEVRQGFGERPIEVQRAGQKLLRRAFREHEDRVTLMGPVAIVRQTEAQPDSSSFLVFLGLIPASPVGPQLMAIVALLTGVYHLGRRRAGGAKAGLAHPANLLDYSETSLRFIASRPRLGRWNLHSVEARAGIGARRAHSATVRDRPIETA
jgi:hypothetical protein